MPEVPVGVISADAIEHLSPLVPLEMPEVGNLPRSGGSKGVEARHRSEYRSLIHPRSGAAQLALTIIPLMVIDLAAISASVLAATGLLSLFGVLTHIGMPLQGIGVLVSYLAIGCYLGLFPGTATSPVMELRQVVRASSLSFALVLLLNRIFAALTFSEVLIGCTAGLFCVVALPLARAFGRYRLGRTRWWGERGVVIGSGPQGRALYNFYRRSPQRGLRVMGLVDLEHDPNQEHAEPVDPLSNRVHGEVPRIGSVKCISRLTRQYDLRWGIVAPAGSDDLSLNEVMKFSSELKHLIVLPSQFLLPSLWANSRECAGVLGVHVSDQLRRPGARLVKSVTDFSIALVALIALSPLLAVFVALIKWKSPGPAFYGHTRIGLGGRTFKAWKLRTMVVDADRVLEEHLERDHEMRQQWIEDQKLRDDPRIIAGIGHFLRKTSLDELPQLWNVLVGEMSLVGPRPIVQNEVERYGELYPLYLRVTPGITGLWQVSGRNDTSYSQRVRLDSYYVCNWSVWLDAYIVIRTIRTLVLREGAY
ncbi:MAG: undecaprenyl-phosphate galactose phosphotransferase WbaP [Planctomycetota bacterium]